MKPDGGFSPTGGTRLSPVSSGRSRINGRSLFGLPANLLQLGQRGLVLDQRQRDLGNQHGARLWTGTFGQHFERMLDALIGDPPTPDGAVIGVAPWLW